MLFDYHIHTTRCKHAEGEMEQYVRAAAERGLSEMGFSDHLPLPDPSWPSPWNMLPDELPLYVQDVLRLREVYSSKDSPAKRPVQIRLGIEADYIEGFEAQTHAQLRRAKWDYVIGSVHHLPASAFANGLVHATHNPSLWCFDAPSEMAEWDRHDVDEVYRAHLRQEIKLARSGLCHIIGHCDLAKKFGHRPRGDMKDAYREAAEAFAAAGMIIELNTAGLRKPVKEIYPSPEFLRILREAGVRITLGSDSHAPQEVAADFDQALTLARQAGYEHIQRCVGSGRFEAIALPAPTAT